MQVITTTLTIESFHLHQNHLTNLIPIMHHQAVIIVVTTIPTTESFQHRQNLNKKLVLFLLSNNSKLKPKMETQMLNSKLGFHT